MVHGLNTIGKKQELVVKLNQDSQTKGIANNIISSINSLEDKTLNLNKIFIKIFKITMKSLDRCERLERNCESDHNALAEYACHNNSRCISGTPGHRNLPQIWQN